MAQPSIRMSLFEELVRALPRLGAAGERVARAAQQAVAADRAREWVPMCEFVDLCGAVQEVAGRDGLRTWAIAGCLAGMQRPRFVPFLEAARAKAGCDPVVLLDHACQAVRVHFQSCGTFAVVSAAEDGATVVQFPLPPELRVESYLLGTAALIEAFPVACGLETGVSIRAGPSLDRAEYHVGWWVPGAMDG